MSLTLYPYTTLFRSRNWYQFTWLSGDHIVEQAVHSLDMMSWAMGDVPPVRISANGGRQARTSTLGNIYDHFAVRSEEHTSELQSRRDIVCRLLLEIYHYTILPTHVTYTLSLHDALPIS